MKKNPNSPKTLKCLKYTQHPQRHTNLIQLKRTPYYFLTLQCKLLVQKYSFIKITEFCYLSGRFHAIIMHFTNENFKKITDQSKLVFRGCFNLKLYRAWHQFGPRGLKMSQKQYTLKKTVYNTYNSDMIWMGFLPQLDHKAVTRGLKEYGQISHEYFFRFWCSLVYILNAQELKWNTYTH